MPVIRMTAATRYRGTWSSAGAGDTWLSTAMGSFRQPEQDAVEDVGLAGDHVPKVEHPDELVKQECPGGDHVLAALGHHRQRRPPGHGHRGPALGAGGD